MKYCKICLENNLRPNVKFKEGKCPSCYYIKRNESEHFWRKRLELLKKITFKYKNSKNNFDCIVGVSGGKDSTRQALWVRDKLGLNPLLVCLSYPPQQVTSTGADNISNLVKLGFDVIISSLAPQTWKIIMKESFLKFANWAKPTELALFSSVPQLAIKFKIPLIIWGENVGLQVGDMASTSKKQYDGKNLRKLNTLNSGDLSWIKSDQLKPVDLLPYKYPSEKDFKKNKIQIIYLGWFWNNWSITYNSKFSSLNGLELRKDEVSNTGDLYGAMALDEDWVIVNQMIRYYKFGFARVTDYLNPEIRSNKISREEAIKIIEKYDGACNEKYIKSFCKYLDISVEKFWSVISNFVNKKLFTINNKKDGPRFIRKFKVGKGI